MGQYINSLILKNERSINSIDYYLDLIVGKTTKVLFQTINDLRIINLPPITLISIVRIYLRLIITQIALALIHNREFEVEKTRLSTNFPDFYLVESAGFNLKPAAGY